MIKADWGVEDIAYLGDDTLVKILVNGTSNMSLVQVAAISGQSISAKVVMKVHCLKTYPF